MPVNPSHNPLYNLLYEKLQDSWDEQRVDKEVAEVSVPHAAPPVHPGQVKDNVNTSSGPHCEKVTHKHAPPK